MKHLKIKDIIVNTSSEKVPIGTIPYIEIGDIDIFNKTYQYKDKKSVSGAKYALKDSIIVSTVRPTRGAISVIKEEKIAVSNAFAIINVDKEQCNYKYLFYMINSNKFYEYLGSNSKGATYPTCSREDVYNYEIVLPSLEEQNKIVKIFENISNNTNIKKQQILSLEQLVKSQFVEMFGNVKDSKYKADYLSNLTYKITDGKHGGCKSEDNSGYYFIGATEIYDNRINYEGCNQITENDFIKDYQRCDLTKNDFVIVNTGATIGKSAIVTDERCYKTLLQKSVALIRTDKTKLLPLYLKYCYDSEPSLYNVGQGCARVNLLLSQIRKTLIPVPPIEQQNKFADFVKQVDKQKYEFEKQLEKLKELQESLMKEYFG